jgi:phage FluMu protein Com
MGIEQPKNNLQPAHEPPPAPPAAAQEGGLQFIVPTAAVELPSGGLFYAEGHPLHNTDSIEIRYMTTKEEDILTNQSYIKNGTAVDKLLQSVIVAPKVNVSDILVGDKNALTVACRVHGYGPEYITKFACPSCGEQNEHMFDLNEIEHIDFAANLQEFSAEIDYTQQRVTLTIPRTKTVLELKILKDTTDSTRKGKSSRKKQKESFVVTKQYEKMIHSVNGNSDPNYVKSYINSMTALDSRYLRSAYGKIVPGVDFKCDFECSDCDHQAEVEVPLTADFFWPKS